MEKYKGFQKVLYCFGYFLGLCALVVIAVFTTPMNIISLFSKKNA